MAEALSDKTDRRQPEAASTGPSCARRIDPTSFEPELHYYPRALNAQIHPTVAYMLALDSRRIISRYCHLHPEVDPAALESTLASQPKSFCWAGADLFNVTTAHGRRQMVVVETNSCPSGQKSMPRVDDQDEQGGYRQLMERTVKPWVTGRRLGPGDLAVVFDKNEMEASGYAAAMADAFGEPVWLATMHDGDPDTEARFDDGVLHVRGPEGWRPIRAAFRYVTQRPWNRIPHVSKTLVLNPIAACLAGGRNKLLAAKAYEFHNATLQGTGLSIRTPETIRAVRLIEVPLWVERFGGQAVVKNPYSNAGQGVWTITRPQELERFLELAHAYEHFIVQSLIGNANWSSRSEHGRLYHVGTVPDKRARIFVADLRMMVSSGPAGFRPVAIYARQARDPLTQALPEDGASWNMLGTNLSIKSADGGWATETQRLLLMDRRDFNRLGIGLDDLIEAFVQTVLATLAIDAMASSLVTRKGKFRHRLFRSLNDDATLGAEIMA
jgi:hypothetical protein